MEASDDEDGTARGFACLAWSRSRCLRWAWQRRRLPPVLQARRLTGARPKSVLRRRRITRCSTRSRVPEPDHAWLAGPTASLPRQVSATTWPWSRPSRTGPGTPRARSRCLRMRRPRPRMRSSPASRACGQACARPSAFTSRTRMASRAERCTRVRGLRQRNGMHGHRAIQHTRGAICIPVCRSHAEIDRRPKVRDPSSTQAMRPESARGADDACPSRRAAVAAGRGTRPAAGGLLPAGAAVRLSDRDLSVSPRGCRHMDDTCESPNCPQAVNPPTVHPAIAKRERQGPPNWTASLISPRRLPNSTAAGGKPSNASNETSVAGDRTRQCQMVRIVAPLRQDISRSINSAQ